MNSFETSVLRVMKDNSVVGVAFLVSDYVAITCAHVVELAGSKDGKTVSLRWGDECEVDCFVDPKLWRSPNEEDVAILKLEKRLEGMKPLILGPSLDTGGHSFTTLGFPEATQEIVGSGKIIGHANINGIKVLQLRSPEITLGFSGAPVLDEITKQVVGMIVAIAPPDKYQRLGATAFAMTSETINGICPILKISQPSPPSKYLSPFYQLPQSPWDFVGRDNELSTLTSNVDMGRVIIGIKGIAGVGKTSLGLRLSEILEERFPDGLIFLDMRGSHEKQPLTPREAMIHVLQSFHPEISYSDSDNVLEALYRSTLHGKKVLLFFDNIRDSNQVISLIPPKDCLMILTSRQHFDLPGLFLLNLDVLNQKESLLMIQEISGNKLSTEQSNIVAKNCGYLPLAIRISVNLLGVRSDWTPEDLIIRLVKQKHEILDSVEASLNLSYKSLDKKLQRRFRQLYVASLIFSRQQQVLRNDTNVTSYVSSLNSKELPESLGLTSTGDVIDVWMWGANIPKFYIYYLLNGIDQISLVLFGLSLNLVYLPKSAFLRMREEEKYSLLLLTSLPLSVLWVLMAIIFVPIAIISFLVCLITFKIMFNQHGKASDSENRMVEYDSVMGTLLSTGLVEYYGPYTGIYGRGLKTYDLLKLHDLTILFAEGEAKKNIFERLLMKRALVTVINRLSSKGDIFDNGPGLRFPGFSKYTFLDMFVG